MARTITFLRHGHSTAPEGAPDKTRRLSDKGREQAQKRREQLGNPTFDLIICSQVIRTAETALEVAGADNIAPAVMLYELFTPHSGSQHDALNRLFAKLGHKPLSAYYADNPADVKEMRKFGAEGWVAIIDEIENFGAENTLVVGHGMYSACMAHASHPKKAECLMDLAQSECDGFVVALEEDEVGYYVKSVTPLPKLE